jgi:co-chaperonin GroES (HSP10)
MMTPLSDRVLIAPDPIATETQSGIALVEDWPQETSGRVTSIGASVRDVAVGDHVLFAQHSGQVLEINKQRLFVMRERDVIAILEAE